MTYYHKTCKTRKTICVLESKPTGCFPAATRLWSRYKLVL